METNQRYQATSQRFLWNMLSDERYVVETRLEHHDSRIPTFVQKLF
jgi:hypothetical protein